MSYILDALQRSEHERQRGEPPSIHSPKISLPRPVRAVWPWLAAAVLLLNLTVLIVWFYRERSAPPPPAPIADIALPELTVPTPQPVSAPAPLATHAVGGAVLEIAELPTRIQQSLPAISLSAHIHVARKPARSFVVINGIKLREGEAVDGLSVEQIKRAELILNYRQYHFRFPVDLE